MESKLGLETRDRTINNKIVLSVKICYWLLLMYYKGECFRQQKQHVSGGVHSDSLGGCKTIWG